MQDTRPFGDYLPDLPGLRHPGLTVAKNALPRSGGYDEQLGQSIVTDFTALNNTARGAIAFIDAAGNPHHFSGTEDKLYHLDTATTEVTRASSAYNATSKAQWEFLRFGPHVIAINPFDDAQFFTIPTSTLFDRLSLTAPRARHQGLVGRHVVFGNTNDSVDGPVTNRIWWPAIGNPFNWPTPGTDDAVAVQSDRSDLEGEGGGIQRVISGAEVGAIFQERAIWRMDYVGSPAIYELNRVEPNRGLLIPGLAVAISRQIFYLAEDGFYAFDYTSSVPIGKDRINKTFLADVDSDFFHRVTSLPDPDATRWYVLYPGSGHNSAGDPNKWICYDWALGRWGHGEFDGDILAHVLPLGLHLDSLPDDFLDIAGSFDDLVAGTGALKLGVYDSNHRLASLDGTPLDAVFETGDLEFMPGRQSILDLVRSLVTGKNSDVTIQVASRGRIKGDIVYGKKRTIDEDGDAGIRQSGRYHRVRTNVSKGFDEAVGFDYQTTRGGWR